MDVESNLRPLIFEKMKEYYGKDRVLQTMTYRAFASKSVALAACKGMGISDSEAHVVASFIPFERGSNWSLHDCFYGNPEHDREPVTAFIERVNEAGGERLKEIMLELEGLIIGQGVHASSQYIFNGSYIEQNSLMRAPGGDLTTAYNMQDSDVQGGLKADLLVIEALDKLHVMMDMLFEDGVLEDKGSVKANYDAYLHPSLVDYDDPEVWGMIGSLAIPELFQCDTQVGKSAVSKIKPRTVLELAAANSLMRLMPQGNEPSPIDVYVAYKNDLSRWYREMEDFGLTADEIRVLEPLLLPEYGVAAVQESIMQLVMDPKIANFTMKEANALRKGVAKKKPKILEEIKELFYKKGAEQGTSKTMLDYVWDKQIARQLGYSFSINHTVPYSVLAVQQAWFIKKYGLLYWGAAIMTVSAGAMEGQGGNLAKATDYSKIALAVNTLKEAGYKIEVPDINRAKIGFRPDPKNNGVLFALKAISGVGEKEVKCIVQRGPYESFDDFVAKCNDTVRDVATIQLIKAGAFDEIEPDRSRYELMCNYVAKNVVGIKKLNLKTIPELIKYEVADISERDRRFLEYEQYIRDKVAIRGGTPGKTWIYVRDENMAEDEFVDQLLGHLKPKDYRSYSDGYTIMTLSALERAKKSRLTVLRETVLNNPKVIEALNLARAKEYIKEKHPGNTSTWEMDALCFYNGPHELTGMDEELYHVENFFDLPEEPKQTTPVTFNGKTYQQYFLTRIAGTVVGKNQNKHTVKLLTKDGIVDVKLYKDLYTEYNRQVSSVSIDGVDKVRERSWFQRGNKLLLTGFRRGDQFVVRTYKTSFLKGDVSLIKGLNPKTGELLLFTERWDQRVRRANRESNI